MNHELITSKQFFRLMTVLITSTGVLYLPSVSIRVAGNGGWLSPMFSSLVGFADIGIVYIMIRLFPGRGLIQFCGDTLGKYGGAIVGLTVSLFFWHCGSNTIAEIVGFIHAYILKRTPMLAVAVFLLAGLSVILHMGVQGFSRLNELLFPSIYLVAIIMIVGLIGSFKPDALLPLLDHGWGGVLKGAYVPSSWFGELLLAGMFLEHVTDGREAVRQVVKACICSALVLVGIVVVVIGTFGSEGGAALNFSAFNVFRAIQIGTFFQHLEIIFEGPLIVFVLIKAILFFYAGTRGVAQSLSIIDSRVLINPFLITTLVVNQWIFARQVDLDEFLLKIWPIYSLAIELVLPLCMLVVYVGRVGVTRWLTK